MTIAPRPLSPRRSLAPVAAALLAACSLPLAACDGSDEAQTAINSASARLDTFGSAGTAPLPTEPFRKQTYDDVISGLKPVAESGSPAQQAAANLLIARGHAGLGEIAAQNASGLERDFLSQLSVARSALDQWVSQNSVADALRSYDPAKDLADLDTQIAARLADAQKLQAEKAAHQQIVDGLNARAADAASRARQQRTAEAELRKTAQGVSQTSRLDVITRATEIRRAADKLDQESSNFAAEAAKEAPRLDELQREMDRYNTQAQLLRTAKTDIQNRRAQSIQQSDIAREESMQAAAKLKVILADLASARAAAASPTQAAVRAYTQAASAAKSASTQVKASAQFSSGVYQQALGDVLSLHANSLAAYAGTLQLIANAKPPLPDLGTAPADADKATQEFQSAKQDAIAAYKSAYDAFGAAGSGADPARIDALKQALAKLADLKPEPEPADAAPAPDAGAAPAGADSPNAALEQEVRAALEAMQPDLTSGDSARVLPHLHFPDPQVQAAIEGLLPFLAKGKDFNSACIDKFGKSFTELVSESQSVAVKSNPLLLQFGPFFSGADGAAPVPSADQYAKFLSPDSRISVVSPTEVQLTVDDLAAGVTLVKIKSAWKVNIDPGQAGASMLNMLAPVLKGASAALDTVTTKLRADGYPNADAMLLDLSAQLMGAMGAGLGGNAPPPAPPDNPDNAPDPDADPGAGGGG